MNSGSLFSGIGGLDLGTELAFGTQPAFFCEIDPAAAAVLKRRFPGVPVYPDIREIDQNVGPVDLLHGGYPCQPFSSAGLRKGKDDHRHLWPEYARLIRVLRPRIVVGENVAGHLTLGFGDVLADLAEMGMDVRWGTVRASDAGAPHRRERLFWIATDTDGEFAEPWYRGGIESSDNPWSVTKERNRNGHDGTPEQRSSVEDAADSKGAERRDTQQQNMGAAGGRTTELGERFVACEVTTDPTSSGRGRVAQHDFGQNEDPAVGRSGNVERGRVGQPERLGMENQIQWGAYEPAIRRWEQICGVAAPEPVDDRGRLMPEFVEWMQGFPLGWTEGGSRNQRLKMLGNAVVPAQANLALRHLAT